MKDLKREASDISRAYSRSAIVFMSIWTLLIVGSAIWNIIAVRREAEFNARIAAIASFEKDFVYRRWASLHGGVYVPVTDDTPPNPHLAHIAERDISTPSGRKLTLVNPAYMTRQVHALGRKQYGDRVHITSLKPLRKANSPDPWERRMLEEFKGRDDEACTVEQVDGKTCLRFMRPLMTEKGCLKCHSDQGYREGDIRGGISVSVPMSPYYQVASEHIVPLLAGHGVILLVGLTGLWIWSRHMGVYKIARLQDAENLRLAQQQYVHAIATSMEGFWIVDLKGHLLDVNDSYIRMSGYSREELLGMKISELEMNEDDDEIQEHMVRMIENGNDHFETSHRHKDGSTLDVSVRARYVEEPEKRFVVFIEDISERKASEQRAEELRYELERTERIKSIGMLAGGVAHDLNNVLGPMVVLPGIVEEGLEDAVNGDRAAREQIIESVQVIKRSAERAAVVVRDLLVLSRRGKYDRVPVDINTLPCLVEGECAGRIEGMVPSNIEIVFNISDRELTSLIATEHLCRVVDNLVINGIDAVGNDGTVTVSTFHRLLSEEYHGYITIPPGEYGVIEIADTGGGIGRDSLERIFEPFYSTKKMSDSSGSGLGLSVVHGIVADHEGFIDVSTELGSGSTFSIYLPLVSSQLEILKPEMPGQVGGGTERILVVDDELSIRFVVKKRLGKLGYRVDDAASGDEAVRIVSEMSSNGQYDEQLKNNRRITGNNRNSRNNRSNGYNGNMK